MVHASVAAGFNSWRAVVAEYATMGAAVAACFTHASERRAFNSWMLNRRRRRRILAVVGIVVGRWAHHLQRAALWKLWLCAAVAGLGHRARAHAQRAALVALADAAARRRETKTVGRRVVVRWQQRGTAKAFESWRAAAATRALALARARAAVVIWDSSGAGAALRRWQTAARDESYR